MDASELITIGSLMNLLGVLLLVVFDIRFAFSRVPSEIGKPTPENRL